jgi:iron complex transport system permease protein
VSSGAAGSLIARPARLTLLLAALVGVAFAAALLALCAGSMDIAPGRILSILLGGGGGTEAQVVLELRLPRVAAGFLVGGMLALAGALMQVLLRNPLAEPYVLGISGGAAVFALSAILAGLGAAWIQAGAFAGALLSVLLVFAIARSGGGTDGLRLLLTGVVLAAGWGALVSLLLAVSPAAKLHGMLFWLMGDLGPAGFSPWALAVLAACLLIALALGRAFNLLAQGDLQAEALGVPVARLRGAIYVIAALLTATAVMQAGTIGFVGLIVPHAARLLLGSDHRVVLPAAVLLGGSLLVLADALARTLIAPQQLPVGVLTALIGVPVFLLLLRTTARRQQP